MATILVSAEGASVRRKGTGKPKVVVRGRRRTSVVKSLHALASLENQDYSENRRGALNDYNPYLILGSSNSKVRKAFETLQEALQKALDEKV